WSLFTTEHFGLYYRPQQVDDRDLDRAAGSAERAYRRVSADLKHELAFTVAVVLVPRRDRIEARNVPAGSEHILLPLDSGGALFDGLVTHEVTHVFAFDILPGRMRAKVPGWIYEGLSEYERGTWTAEHLAALRTLATSSNQLPAVLNALDDGAPNLLR